MTNNEVFTRKEYIEREQAVMKIREWFWSAPGVHPKLDRDAAEELLFSLHAADVAPVRHGKWIPVTNGRGGSECNQCHTYAPSHQCGIEYKSAFCPNCGALMDKDGDVE